MYGINERKRLVERAIDLKYSFFSLEEVKNIPILQKTREKWRRIALPIAIELKELFILVNEILRQQNKEFVEMDDWYEWLMVINWSIYGPKTKLLLVTI